MVTPLVGDISSSAREWWSEILAETATVYERWLSSTILERIRLRAPEVARSETYLRLEQKMVPLLLKSMPELVKADLVFNRVMNVVGMMLRLWTLYQPGGSSERISILHQLTEGKVPTSADDLLSGLRKWRRMRTGYRAQSDTAGLSDPDRHLGKVCGRSREAWRNAALLSNCFSTSGAGGGCEANSGCG